MRSRVLVTFAVTLSMLAEVAPADREPANLVSGSEPFTQCDTRLIALLAVGATRRVGQPEPAPKAARRRSPARRRHRHSRSPAARPMSAWTEALPAARARRIGDHHRHRDCGADLRRRARSGIHRRSSTC